MLRYPTVCTILANLIIDGKATIKDIAPFLQEEVKEVLRTLNREDLTN